MNASHQVSKHAKELEQANEILREWNRQQLVVAAYIAFPAAVGLIFALAFTGLLGGAALPVGCALGLTAGVALCRDLVRSRSGSLWIAFALVALLWLAAIGVALISLL
ncbi:hypothetical protein Pla123a_03760 [Posidoniimonas polymericola]|uniref:VIT family protein n=1 Tax=Posidoniimonas polymericola TaxID=2528002 RepID=A0A5C5ZDS7_9BACT|nr:hypothetical protein [Posidoniimonas polymericola]TWT85569.1 hypothetical protein Pla123a_03760 [Posidoniimonas polymericola]